MLHKSLCSCFVFWVGLQRSLSSLYAMYNVITLLHLTSQTCFWCQNFYLSLISACVRCLVRTSSMSNEPKPFMVTSEDVRYFFFFLLLPITGEHGAYLKKRLVPFPEFSLTLKKTSCSCITVTWKTKKEDWSTCEWFFKRTFYNMRICTSTTWPSEVQFVHQMLTLFNQRCGQNQL